VTCLALVGGCISYAYFWKNLLIKELMDSFYKRNYGNALGMVNMNVQLTHLVKYKLDRPYWELIANKK
jgi:hypothetical protein